MSITINYPIDELQLDDLIAQGWTTLKLYSSNTPDGPYTDTSISPSPSTLATILSTGLPYMATFSYGSGNGGMWFKVVATDGIATSSLNDSEPFHGGGGTTLQVIRQRTGKLAHLLKTGVTTTDGGVSGLTALCANASFTRYRDNYFGGGNGIDGWFFHRLDTNEWSVITGFVQTSGQFSFTPAFSSQIHSGTSFEITARFDPDEYREAINWAIATAYPTLSKPVVDTNTSTVDEVFVYPIPFNIRILNKVEIEQSDTTLPLSTDPRTRGQPWRQIAYDMVDDGISRTVEFKTELDKERRLRFTGTAMLSQMYNDSDYTEILDPQIDLIAYLALSRLYQQLANTDAASDVDRVRQLSQDYMNMYNENRARHATRRKSKKIWSHDAKWATY